MRFSRTKLLRRCLLSSALLASGAVTSAADQAGNMGLLQGLITGRKAASTTQTAPSTQSTTVQAELQKLFQTGQVQTSQHQTAAANSSVQQIQHESDVENPGLFRQLFGGSTSAERRAKRLEGRTNRTNPQGTNRSPSVPKPPPIDFATQQRPQQRASINARPVGFANEVSPPPGVPPVGAISDGRFTLKPAAVDQFISPFIDDESLERNSMALDLDSLIDRPADRSEAMPITTEGDVVQRLIELPIPLKGPASDPLLEENTITLPAVDNIVIEPVAIDPIATDPINLESMAELLNTEVAADSTVATTVAEIEEVVEVMVIQSKVAPTKVVDARTTSEAAISNNDMNTVEAEATATVPVAEEAAEQTIQTPEMRNVENVRLSIQEKNARRQQQRYLILSRAGRAGFKGFCPVALRETRMLRDSSTNHAARFGLKTYYFSSDDTRLQFEADPARFAPAAGGSDVVLLANTGEETEGSLDFCLWYRDRLYMFRSRETQAIFSADPARFANQY